MNTAFKPRSDGRIHLATTGEFPCTVKGKDGKPVKKVQRVTAADLAGLVANWKAAGSREVLLDIDHESLDPAKRTEAAAWVGELHTDAEGLWGKPRYTEVGNAAVTSGRYRYISPVWTTEEVGADALRPVTLTSAALTNRPNIKTLHSVANRDPLSAQPTITMNAIAKALGLPETATEEEILAAIKALQDAGKGLEAEVAANRKAAAEVIAKNRGITDPASVTKFVEQYVANREGVEAVLGLLPAAATPPARTPITSVKPAAVVPGAAAGEEVANREQNRDGLISRIQRERGVDFSTAWALGSAEKPDLFRE